MITANLYFNRIDGWNGWRIGRILPDLVQHFISEQGCSDNILIAYVNHGNWLIKCPDCEGCEYAWEEGYFMCLNCFNASVGHKYRRSQFPIERKEIEQLLIVRPLPNRNWKPGETLEFLKTENELHDSELLEVKYGMD